VLPRRGHRRVAKGALRTNRDGHEEQADEGAAGAGAGQEELGEPLRGHSPCPFHQRRELEDLRWLTRSRVDGQSLGSLPHATRVQPGQDIGPLEADDVVPDDLGGQRTSERGVTQDVYTN
jgi:hypothetical protein